MFMNAAPATDDRAKDPAKRDPERGRLLGLVRKLLDYGREIVATLQGHNGPLPPAAIARTFSSLNVALIITRITRGLMIAAALEQRLLRPAPPLGERAERPERPERIERKEPAKPRAKPAPRPPIPDPDAELLGQLPSAKEIAARIRNRPAGAVIVEICRDLGIACDHPLWLEIRDAIRHHGGNLAIMLRNILRPYDEAVEDAFPFEEPPHFDQFLAIRAQPP